MLALQWSTCLQNPGLFGIQYLDDSNNDVVQSYLVSVSIIDKIGAIIILPDA